ncbi:hypothetical protein GCM10009740_02940 [Terrabacter terrae]|uniref:HYR domain-containing protein n=1 Tax=Terrabacter terrae TaxID=318434 RepID=A0ABP5FBI1_9MICO
MRARSLLAALTAAVTLGAAGAGIAYADGLDFVQDNLQPISGNFTVKACSGQSTTFDVLIAARRNGQPGTKDDNVFANDSSVTVAIDSVSSPLTAKLDKDTVNVPSNWASSPTNTLTTDMVKVTFTLPPQTSSGSGSAKLAYQGHNRSGGDVSGTNTIAFSWTPGQCDVTPPTLHLPAALTVEATSAGGAVVNYNATATDAAPANPTVTCDPASGATFPLGTTTVSCSATDAAGNKATGSFTVMVKDTTPPVVTLPADISVEATGSSTAVSWDQPTATDSVDGSRDVTCMPASGSSFSVGTTTVSCTATDAAGNTGTASFKVTVSDTKAPVLSLPTDITAEATGPDGAAVGYVASAADVVDGAVTPVCDPKSGSTFALGKSTVRCAATDKAGNAASGSFTVTVQDTTAPDLTVPDPITVEATGPDGAAADFAVSASDLVDGAVKPVCDATSGSTFPLGTTTVHCSATDAAGNEDRAGFTVTVQDTTPPTITVPADMVLEATGPDGATATYTAEAEDLVDGTFKATCTPASGSTFPLGATQVNCNATDKHGNPAATTSFAVTVQDTTAPKLTMPADFAVEATGPDGAAVTYVASAMDIVDGAVEPSCDVATGTVLSLGAHKITCTATDAHHNVATGSFTATVRDTTPPAVTVPKDVTTEATGPNGAVVEFSASATDIVDGAVTSTCAPASGSTFPLGTTAVTCAATDAHGNVGHGSFSVKVQDTTGPVISWIAPAAGGSYPYGSVPTPSCVATDLVSGPAPCSVIGYDGGIGTHTLTATATDAAGNVSHATRSYTVVRWGLKGFYQPVDMGGVVNTVKAGSTVPLKFEIFSGTTELTNVSAVKSFTAKSVSCGTLTSAATDDVEVTSTGGTTLRYDSTGGQFIQNWQTPKTAGACYQVTMTAQDSSTISAFFKLK